MDTKKEQENKYITQAELAERWKLSEWAIWSMRRRGELPAALRICRRLRWRLSVIEDWEMKQTIPASEFDPVLCERAAKAVKARGQKQVKVEAERTRGRPTKVALIEQRRTAGGEA